MDFLIIFFFLFALLYHYYEMRSIVRQWGNAFTKKNDFRSRKLNCYVEVEKTNMIWNYLTSIMWFECKIRVNLISLNQWLWNILLDNFCSFLWLLSKLNISFGFVVLTWCSNCVLYSPLSDKIFFFYQLNVVSDMIHLVNKRLAKRQMFVGLWFISRLSVV